MARPFFKVRLSDTPESWDAARTVTIWRNARQMSFHLVRAIRLYAALLAGDTSVLEQYFPFAANALGRSPVPHAVTRPRLARDYGEPEIVEKPKSDEDEFKDAVDGLGLDGLSFG